MLRMHSNMQELLVFSLLSVGCAQGSDIMTRSFYKQWRFIELHMAKDP